MLEITCQDSDVTIVSVGDLRVIRVSDVLAGITINVPLTPQALALLLRDESVPLAA